MFGTTLRTCPLSSVKQIFHYGKLIRNGVRKTYERIISNSNSILDISIVDKEKNGVDFNNDMSS